MARQNMMQSFVLSEAKHVVSAGVVEVRVGTEASHEEQLRSMFVDLQNMFPVQNETSRSRRPSRTGHSVKIIDSHDKIDFCCRIGGEDR